MLNNPCTIKKPGIYAVVNALNGKRYIGSALNLKRRYRQHCKAIHVGGANIKLQRAYKKYGESLFSFEPLIICDKKDLLFYEERAISAFNSVDAGYNCRKIPYSNIGIKLPHSEETKRKIGRVNAISLLGNKIRFGTTQSAIARQKMSKTKRKIFRQYEYDGKKMCL